MITVLNGGKFVEKISSLDANQRRSVIQEFTRLIHGAQSYIESIEFINKTKKCAVNIYVDHGKMIVVFENPDDEIFKLEESDVTPSTIG